MISKRILSVAVLLAAACLGLFAGGSSESTGGGGGTAGTGPRMEWIMYDANMNLKYVETAERSPQPPDAVGLREYDSKGRLKSVTWFSQETKLLGQWIDAIGASMDEIVYRIAMAIHPFPSVMFNLYGFDIDPSATIRGYKMQVGDGSGFKEFSTDSLLISNEYYRGNSLRDNVQSSKWIVPISEDPSNISTSPLQKAKWTIIAILFVTFLAAEIIFTAEWGYITGSSENVLKDIAKKVGITLALFVLVSALPFLVESMRYGLFRIADVFYGSSADLYYETASIKNPLKDPLDIFRLPGKFMSQMKVFFVKSNSEYGTQALSSLFVGDNGSKEMEGLQGILTTLLVWLIYQFFRFFMFINILKAAIHIAMNIIEVYLFLGLSMILVPFSVFEPTKALGTKCVMSLLTNLIECFLIVVIMSAIIPAVIVSVSTILDNSMTLVDGTAALAEISVDGYYYGNTTLLGNGQPFNHKTRIIAGEGYVMVVNELGNQGGHTIAALWATAENKNLQDEQDIMAMEEVSWWINMTALTGEGENGSSVALTNEMIINALNPTEHLGNVDKKSLADPKKGTVSLGDTAARYYIGDMIVILDELVSEYFKEMGALIQQGQSPQRMEVANRIADNLSGNKGFIEAIKDLSYPNTTLVQLSEPLAKAATTYEAKSHSYDYSIMMFLQLTLLFMGTYIPVFFIQQSTQMTNSLMNGTAAMESFANAMSRDATTAMQKATTGVASAIGNGAQKITGAVTGAKNAANTGSIANNVSSIAANMAKAADDNPSKK